jgi:hypothetical protein
MRLRILALDEPSPDFVETGTHTAPADPMAFMNGIGFPVAVSNLHYRRLHDPGPPSRPHTIQAQLTRRAICITNNLAPAARFTFGGAGVDVSD